KCINEISSKKIPKLLDFKPLNSEAQLIYQYIVNNYQSTSSIKDITLALNYSNSTFYKKFLAYFKVSYTEFLTLYRLQQALLLLSYSDLSITSIAYEVGFNDYKYFHRVFLRYVKMSPTAYVKKFEMRE
ncbi:MAG: helix-turn-helix domain-containing protein, partial [Bacilli bacterium]